MRSGRGSPVASSLGWAVRPISGGYGSECLTSAMSNEFFRSGVSVTDSIGLFGC